MEPYITKSVSLAAKNIWGNFIVPMKRHMQKNARNMAKQDHYSLDSLTLFDS